MVLVGDGVVTVALMGAGGVAPWTLVALDVWFTTVLMRAWATAGLVILSRDCPVDTWLTMRAVVGWPPEVFGSNTTCPTCPMPPAGNGTS